MGCATSKLDDLPAVALCRERCSFLDEAVCQRFIFAEAHLAYLHSLKAVGLSLDRFFSQDLDLPSQRKKGEPIHPPDKIQHHIHSLSDSSAGSHLHFHSDGDDSEDGSESLHHHHNDVGSPVHQSYGGYLTGYGGGGGFMNFNYMKKHTTPSVVHTQRPMSTETMHMGESSYASSSSYNPYPPPPPNSYAYSNNNNNNNNFNGYPNYGARGGFSDGSSPPSQYPEVAKAPPPPPSPPRNSGWDFLNPFESFEKYYPAYTPSRDSREVREEEGIPELEDEDDDEVVKEVHGDQKFVEVAEEEEKEKEKDARVSMKDAEFQYRADSRPSVVGMTESNPVEEYEVLLVDKNVVGATDHERLKNRFKPGFKADSDVVREIQLQFDRASESGTELAKFLEVGKVPYKRKHVSSKILHLPVMSSQPLNLKSSDNAAPAYIDADQDVELRSKNLSSTLHKLYLWEKKLYEEVKVEEKMRVLHERKSRKLKRLNEKGAEATKVDVTRTLVRSLSTKIRISIQVVDKISVKINGLRDDDLWPQLNEFIQGLTRMWKSMLECHQNQCQAIGEAERLDAIAFRKHFSDAHFEATRQLEHDLINWTLKFSYWVGAQKGYVRALTNWLMKCLLYVPEETPDGIVPFSPGRIGAPPVFVVCNQWWQSLDRISNKEVVDSMRDFASNVLQLWDRDKIEIRQRMLANKEEMKLKSLDKEDLKIQKEIQALDKRIVLKSIAADVNGKTGHVVYQSETTRTGGSLQASLRRVLEAMERFTSSSLKVYEDLLQRIEEDHVSREHG